MNFRLNSHAALAALAFMLFASGVASAGGPFIPKFVPLPKDATCDPINRSDACQRTDKDFKVNKADGSGTTIVSLIEDRTLSYSKIAKTGKVMGEPYFPKDDSYTKKTLAARPYYGAMLKPSGEIIEPAIYPYLIPVSDKVALAKANESSRFYGKDNAYRLETNKFYFVNMDGKLTQPERPGIDPRNLYFIGGYYGSLPAQVFEVIGRDEARGTVTMRQYDSYGNERAVFDNIILHKRKDIYDSYELSFYVNSQYDFVVSALHPETGEPAALWFKADGSVIGYRVSAVVRSTLELGSKDRVQPELVEVVGQLPVITSLRDDRLYHPLDLDGERVAAPSNFIGMARMFQSHSSAGDLSSAMSYYRGWLLVYALPTGYGYKIADSGSSSHQYPAIVNAEDVLLSEKSLKMFSGFGYSRVADGSLAIILRPFDRYEADGVTPADRALPAEWHRVFQSQTKFTATEGELAAKSYPTSTEAFFAIGQDEIAQDRAYAQRQAEYKRQLAEREAEQAVERARREAELRAHFEREAKREAEYAKARAQYRPKTGAEEFNERMALMKNHWNRPNPVELPAGTKICYDMGDGSDFCFAY